MERNTFNPQFGDLPAWHFLESALDEMGVYDMARIFKFADKGWKYHWYRSYAHPDAEWPFPVETGFLWKTLNDGREVRIYDRRTFLKGRKWFVIRVIDQYGRETGDQYFTFD